MATATEAAGAAAVIKTEANEGKTLEAAIQATEQRRVGITKTAAAFLGIPHEKVFELLGNVWTTSKGQPPLTKEEMFAGISMIARFELDPISREIYVTRDNKGRLMTIIGVDGWIKILDRTDHYDGFEQEVEWNEGGTAVEWVETRIYSTKRGHPAVYRAFTKEYIKVAGYMNEKLPWHMLRIFSLRHAARLFVPLGGNVMTEEEASFILAGGAEHEAALSSLDDLASHFDKPASTDKAPVNKESSQPDPPAPAPETTIEPAKPEDAGRPDDTTQQAILLDETAQAIEIATQPSDLTELKGYIEKNAALTEETRETALALLAKRKKAMEPKREKSGGKGSKDLF